MVNVENTDELTISQVILITCINFRVWELFSFQFTYKNN